MIRNPTLELGMPAWPPDALNMGSGQQAHRKYGLTEKQALTGRRKLPARPGMPSTGRKREGEGKGGLLKKITPKYQRAKRGQLQSSERRHALRGVRLRGGHSIRFTCVFTIQEATENGDPAFHF